MVDMMNVTVGKLLEQVAEKYPDDEAVKFTDRVTAAPGRNSMKRQKPLPRAFWKGIRKGDHVAIWATNVPEWIADLFRLYQNRCGAGHCQYRV